MPLGVHNLIRNVTKETQSKHHSVVPALCCPLNLTVTRVNARKENAVLSMT